MLSALRGASGSRLADATGNRKFVDSPLERDGFELSVPGRKRVRPFRC